MATEPAPTPLPRRRRWRRRLLALGVTVLIVFALAVLALWIALRSDLPRRMAVHALQQRTGLRVSIGSLHVGWRGESTVRDIVVRLPLDDAPIFTAPEVRVTHASLPMVLLTRDPGIAEVHLKRPEINMVQGETGEWTLLRAADLAQAANASAGASGAVALPVIESEGGVVHLRRPGKQDVALPLTVREKPDGPLVADVDMTLGGARITGRVTTTTWDQSLDVEASGVEDLVRLWSSDVPAPVSLDAHWEGRLNPDGAVTGDVHVRAARAGEHRVKGRLQVRLESDDVSIVGSALEVASPEIPGGKLEVKDVAARMQGSTASCERLLARIEGADVQLSGSWKVDTFTGAVTVDWSKAGEAASVRHSGHAELTASLPPSGPLAVAGDVAASGSAAAVLWRLRSTFKAEGPNWRDVGGQISAPTLLLSMNGDVLDLSGLRAGLRREGTLAELTSLTLPNAATTEATGEFDSAGSAWRLDARIAGLRDARLPGSPVGLVVSAWGNTHAAEIGRLELSSSRGDILVSGTYDTSREIPLQARLQASAPVPELAAGHEAPTGAVTCDVEVQGSITPLVLNASGALSVPATRVASGSIGPLEVPVQVLAESDAISFRTAPVSILEGCVGVEGALWMNPSLAALSVTAEGLPLDRLTELVAPGMRVGGTLDTRFVVRVPSLDLSRADASGEWNISDAGRGLWAVPAGQGAFATNGADVRLTDVRLRNADAEASGSVEIHDGIIGVDLTAHRWPVSDPETGISGAADAEVSLKIDAAAKSAKGKAQASAEAKFPDGTPISATIAATVEGRTIRAESLSVDVLDGRMSGTATLPIDDWKKATASISLERMDLSRLGAMIDPDVDLRGTASGSLEMNPAADARALEPVRIGVDLRIADGSVHRIQLGDISLVAFAGPDRVILDQSALAIAGGTINAWSRLSRHGKEPFLAVNLLAKDLDVNQLVHAASPAIAPTPGRLDVRASGGGYFNSPHRAFGEALIEARNADLQPLPAFAVLYDILNINLGKPVPEGEGMVKLRLEGDALRIARLQYFNRGTDINGAGRIENVWRGTESPIEGALVATLRPLKKSKIPFGPELDRVLNGLLGGAASVKLTGNARSPEIKVVPLADVVSFFQGVFGVRDFK
jgi:hypothetical protein